MHAVSPAQGDHAQLLQLQVQHGVQSILLVFSLHLALEFHYLINWLTFF
jgi:hypothetical protein